MEDSKEKKESNAIKSPDSGNSKETSASEKPSGISDRENGHGKAESSRVVGSQKECDSVAETTESEEKSDGGERKQPNKEVAKVKALVVVDRPSKGYVRKGTKAFPPRNTDPKGRGAKKKSADMPRRPLSAYNYFFRENRNIMLAERDRALERGEAAEKGTNLFATMGREIAKKWKALTPEHLEKYTQLAHEDMKRYRREMDEYHLDAARKARVDQEDNDRKRKSEENIAAKRRTSSDEEPPAGSNAAAAGPAAIALQGLPAGAYLVVPAQQGVVSDPQALVLGANPQLDPWVRAQLLQGRGQGNTSYLAPQFIGSSLLGGGSPYASIGQSQLNSSLMGSQTASSLQQQAFDQQAALGQSQGLSAAAYGSQYAFAGLPPPLPPPQEPFIARSQDAYLQDILRQQDALRQQSQLTSLPYLGAGGYAAPQLSAAAASPPDVLGLVGGAAPYHQQALQAGAGDPGASRQFQLLLLQQQPGPEGQQPLAAPVALQGLHGYSDAKPKRKKSKVSPEDVRAGDDPNGSESE